MTLHEVITVLANLVWGPPMLILLGGTGIYLTVLLRGVQFTHLGRGLRLALIVRKEEGIGDISHFQALMTALAATVGTGNIAGVATAIASGGPGALFWMWVIGFVGMATKFAEALLAVKYRSTDERGQMAGGPMYYLDRGLGLKWLAVIYAVLALITGLVTGNMVQSNSVADALKTSFGVPAITTGLILSTATGIVILGGVRSIALAASLIVPVMILFYVGGGLVILGINWRGIPDIAVYVLHDAFAPAAAAGGFAGATVAEGIRYGVARGVFSNESGLGSGAFAAAAAQTKHPVTQALVSMTQTFIDTIVVCSITGFAIIATGAWKTGLAGAGLTHVAFSTGLPGEWGGAIVAISLALFAYSTLVGWNYYGEKALEYLFGHSRFVPAYRVIWVLLTFVGTLTSLETVWSMADVFNGAMAFPNLVGLVGLSGVIARETRGHLRTADARSDQRG